MENLIEELTKVNLSNLSEEGLKLFNKINEVIDRNEELEKAIHHEYELGRAQTEYEVNEYWKSLIKEKIEELNEYYKKEIYPSLINWSDVDITEYYDGMIGILEELLKGDYAKKQMELPSQNVLVCNAIRDIATTGKIQVLEELLGEEK